ncbi:MAG: anthranilate synthase component I family protein [Salinivirgaceae bacterium]|jgi:anthranilate synthase component 1|nr:anthranilate synthase component I family protein [Salinivirgaceae bacterium]
MKQFNFSVNTKEILADVLTPVAIYLKLRDVFPNSILLEGADFKAGDNQYSFICLNPMAGIKAVGPNIAISYPNGSEESIELKNMSDATALLSEFAKAFIPISSMEKVPASGLFGYSTYEAVTYFEDIKLQKPEAADQIPDMLFQFYKYIVVINHTSNRLTLVEHIFGKEDSQLKFIEEQLQNRTFATYRFNTKEGEETNITNEEYMAMVAKGKEHCLRGDVFQIVLSRAFSQQFTGDDFNVYRALRSINPSPYLFYFDFGGFKLLGSSPEAQIKTNDGKAYINPIAGTFKRTGNDKEDKALAEKLSADPKENSEHIMLVDLARNDLSRNADNVKVRFFREIHYYSHVLHMVSEVQGEIRPDADPVRIYADTYPAGTLTGAPKYKAMELINKYENKARGYYGGCIGNIGLDGKINLAITIRSFMSRNNTLHYQAGAGVVADSSEESELAEVNNKLAALKMAIEEAKKI